MSDQKIQPPKKTVAFWIFVALASPFAIITLLATSCGVGEIGNLRLSLAPVFFGIAFGAACVAGLLLLVAFKVTPKVDFGRWIPRPGIRDLLWLVVVISLCLAWRNDHQKHILPGPLSFQQIRFIAETEVAKRYPSASRRIGRVSISPIKPDKSFYLVEINTRSDLVGSQFKVRISETGQVEDVIVSKAR